MHDGCENTRRKQKLANSFFRIEAVCGYISVSFVARNSLSLISNQLRRANLLCKMTERRTPVDFLKSILGKAVVVKLNSGVEYRGTKHNEFRRVSKSYLAGVLACLDGYMNIAMEQAEEYVNGQLKNKYGDAFIRGNNGISSPVEIYFRSHFFQCCI